MKKQLSCLILAGSVSCLGAPTARIRIECDQSTVALPPHLYGLFFEDINYAADGGLYAELVQNRSFEYYEVQNAQLPPLFAWEKIEPGDARVEATVVDVDPLNDNNTHYLELKITQAGEAGIANTGYDGIHLSRGAGYDVSLYARATDWSGDPAVTVRLEDGERTCGVLTFSGVDPVWRKFEGVITATRTVDNARLVVTTKGQGTLNLDMVSLFPHDTWNGRKNGLRKDLVQALKDLNPKFLRFPGGCIAHGWGLDNIYRWKDSVGDVAERKPNWNLWGYHQAYGLGYYEYFLLCEDLDMAALPVVPIGVGCGFRCNEFVPLDELQPHIQDALDLIEFANGPVSSRWGAVRATMGHPESFHVEYICLGNEEHDTPDMRERFPLFVDAIREAYPEIKIIGTSGLGPEIPIYDLMTREKVYSSDEHYYMKPEWFLNNRDRFDGFDRDKPKIFVGEYAAHDAGRENTLYSALSEAAFLTGIERNADIVDMTCYAPLLGREGHCQWNPDLIYFNKRRVVRTANYYVQQLFAQNKGDRYLAHKVDLTGEAMPETVSGRVGIGSWNTAIEVAEVSVNGKKLDPAEWKAESGRYQVEDGMLIQSDDRATPAMSLSPETFSGPRVTYRLRARVTKGGEGFLVRCGADEEGQSGFWWNIGGWNNTRHAIEEFMGDSKVQSAGVPGSIEPGRWYDIRVELHPGRVRCFLDNQELLHLDLKPMSLSVSSTRDLAAGEVIVKLVNPTPKPIETRIELAGVQRVVSQARLWSMSGEKGAVNTFDRPDTVRPVAGEIEAAPEFSHTVPAMAVEVIRIKVD